MEKIKNNNKAIMVKIFKELFGMKNGRIIKMIPIAPTKISVMITLISKNPYFKIESVIDDKNITV